MTVSDKIPGQTSPTLQILCSFPEAAIGLEKMHRICLSLNFLSCHLPFSHSSVRKRTLASENSLTSFLPYKYLPLKILLSPFLPSTRVPLIPPKADFSPHAWIPSLLGYLPA